MARVFVLRTRDDPAWDIGRVGPHRITPTELLHPLRLSNGGTSTDCTVNLTSATPPRRGRLMLALPRASLKKHPVAPRAPTDHLETVVTLC